MAFRGRVTLAGTKGGGEGSPGSGPGVRRSHGGLPIGWSLAFTAEPSGGAADRWAARFLQRRRGVPKEWPLPLQWRRCRNDSVEPRRGGPRSVVVGTP
jgi:hypothetical protein